MKKFLLITTMVSADYDEFHTCTNTYELGMFDDIKDMIKVANDDLKCLAEECYGNIDGEDMPKEFEDNYCNSDRDEYYDFDINTMRVGSGRMLLHTSYTSPELTFCNDITYTIFRIGE